MRTCLATLLVAVACVAQPAPSFEVASIKLNPDGPETSFSYDVASSGVLTSRNVTLWNLIRFAFAVRDNQLAGAPAWAKTKVSTSRRNPPRLCPASNRSRCCKHF
jgi:hypothetical protein